jgi:YHS domain-containing protein
MVMAMTFLHDSLQAVVLIACEKHAAAIGEKIRNFPDGNWFVLPPAAACRMGYRPHVSPAHEGGGCAIFGFAERGAMMHALHELSEQNEDGSLCADCVAYGWGIAPMPLVENARDPVCGRNVDCDNALAHQHENELFFFCGMNCRDAFRAHPERYLKKAVREKV